MTAVRNPGGGAQRELAAGPAPLFEGDQSPRRWCERPAASSGGQEVSVFCGERASPPSPHTGTPPGPIFIFIYFYIPGLDISPSPSICPPQGTSGPDPGLQVTSHPSNTHPPLIFGYNISPHITSIILTSSFGTITGPIRFVRVTEATSLALAGPPQGPYHHIRLAASGPAPYIISLLCILYSPLTGP